MLGMFLGVGDVSRMLPMFLEMFLAVGDNFAEIFPLGQ